MTSTQAISEHTFTKKVNKFLSKFSYWIVGIVIAIGASVYNQSMERLESVERQVQILFQEKASREELKEAINQRSGEMLNLKTDFTRQQNEMKSDILGRLDYMLRLFPPQQYSQPKLKE